MTTLRQMLLNLSKWWLKVSQSAERHYLEWKINQFPIRENVFADMHGMLSPCEYDWQTQCKPTVQFHWRSELDTSELWLCTDCEKDRRFLWHDALLLSTSRDHTDACTNASVGCPARLKERTRKLPKIALVSTPPPAGPCCTQGHHIPSIFQPFIDGMST